jgi:hypothetical protein
VPRHTLHRRAADRVGENQRLTDATIASSHAHLA